MLAIIADVDISRRKRVHLVVNEAGEVELAASRLEDVLAWLEEREVTRLLIETKSGRTYLADLKRQINALDAKQPPAAETAL